jgi:hypothetical protein
VRVGLSTWFRQDVNDIRRRIATPGEHARIWIETIAALRRAGGADDLLFVDLCNEFPGDKWAPFFQNAPHSAWDGTTDAAVAWMQAAVAAFRAAEPGLPCTVSFAGFDAGQRVDWSFCDLLEPHIWMAQSTPEFYREVGYHYQGRDPSGLEALAQRAEPSYRARPEYWQRFLCERIHGWAETSRRCARPLMTTECWGPVDYKDWPGLDWGWVKELCEYGVHEALATERWIAVATSNFCGPQFHGMWRDVAWHQRLTRSIKTARHAWMPLASR